MDEDMDTPMSMADGIVPPPNSPLGTAAEVTKVIHKFKNLEISNLDGQGGICDLSITKQFESLDIGSGSPRHIGHNSVQTTVAESTRPRPHKNRVHTIQRPIHHPALRLDVSPNSIGRSEDNLGERISEVTDLDEWIDCVTMRQAVFKEGKRRKTAARKRPSRGPTRKKIGGVSRHRSARPRRPRL